MVVDSRSVAVTLTLVIVTLSSNELLDIEANIKCGFTLKCVRDKRRRYSPMNRTDNYSKIRSLLLSVWLNGSVFVDELSGCGFETRYIHLNFRIALVLSKG